MDTTTIFAPLGKSEQLDDGSLLVYGKITGPDLDHDGQICDPTWLKSAVPDWFAVGNIREMHQPSAVGKAVDLETHGDDYYITAKIVDPTAVAKVQAGVYTGFSIGIKGPKFTADVLAKNGRITGGRIIETSLADMPVNGTSQLVLAKAEGVTDDTPDEAIDLVKPDVVGKAELDELTAPIEGDAEGAEIGIVAQLKNLATTWLAQEAAEASESGGSTIVVRLITYLLDDIDWAAEVDAMDDLAQAEAALNARINPPIIADGDEMLTLNQVADLVKVAVADDATDDQKASVAELRKALGIEDIATQLTEVQAPAEELKELAGRLTKVEEMAAPGGPVRIAPETEAAKAGARDEILAKVAQLDVTIRQAPPRSPVATDAIAQKAELVEQLNKLA